MESSSTAASQHGRLDVAATDRSPLKWNLRLMSPAPLRTPRPRLKVNVPLIMLALFAALFVQGCSWGERDDILILVRADDRISEAIGAYYASVRGIPSDRIFALPLSESTGRDEIDRTTFDTEIAAPIETYLAMHDPKNRISTLITTRGLPIRIGRCESDQPHYPRDCRSSSVDAALAGLGRLSPWMSGDVSPDEPVAAGPFAGNANPYFADPRSFAAFRRDEPDAKLRFLVARLTGPPTLDDSGSPIPTALRNLIDGSSQAESEGAPVWRVLANRERGARDPASSALLDPIVEQLPRNGHRVCDGCAIQAWSTPPNGVIVQRVQRATDASTERVFEANPSRPRRLAFPGLVIELASIESEPGHFDRSIGDWLSRGARAISMHLEDPSLGGVTRPEVQLRAWAEGRSVVEAHFNSVPHLGWMNVFVGDPLLTARNPASSRNGDIDGDGVADDEDNCVDVANGDQSDSNGDGFGNRCDADVNNDGRIDTSWGKIYPVDQRGDLEIIALTARNGPFDPDHDLDGDGRVDDRDLALAQLWLFRKPGPSATR